MPILLLRWPYTFWDKIIFLMQSLQGTIKLFCFIFKRQRARTVPDRKLIRAYFTNLPQHQQKRLIRIDFSRSDAKEPNHRCHVIGVSVAKALFLQSIRHCKWRPSGGVMTNLIKKVINYEGNFTICQASYNLKRRKGQDILSNILKKGDKNITIGQSQIGQLMTVLYAIRKRQYDLFFQRCRKYGVPSYVTKHQFNFLQQIYKKAKRVKASMIELKKEANPDLFANSHSITLRTNSSDNRNSC